jgi:4-hydroxybenzoate polyprenyltransferase
MVDRDDDLCIGMKTSAITLGRADVPVVMLCYAAFLVIWALSLSSRDLGPFFHLGLTLAAAQAVWHYTLIRGRSREGCFRAFRLNHWMGFTIFAGTAASYAVK